MITTESQTVVEGKVSIVVVPFKLVSQVAAKTNMVSLGNKVVLIISNESQPAELLSKTSETPTMAGSQVPLDR